MGIRPSRISTVRPLVHAGKANCIVAFRPAAILQPDEMKRHAKALRDRLWWNVGPAGNPGAGTEACEKLETISDLRVLLPVFQAKTAGHLNSSKTSWKVLQSLR